ncbi:MAG: 50S ribosomal protein L24 [Dehalococcoidia bacterium]|nr:50S ribosomal protein L24 [Dehalococcoidia bacterium]
MKIRRDDTVVVIAGRDKGKRGKVRQSLKRESCVVVEGVNMVKRHTRPRGTVRQAGIIEREAPLHISNVMLLCPKCDHPARLGFRILEDGSRVRVCRRCHEVID